MANTRYSKQGRRGTDSKTGIKLQKIIDFPKDIEISIELPAKTITVAGRLGKVSKRMYYPGISLSKEGDKIVLTPAKNTKHEKKIVNTFCSHIKNMIKGVKQGYTYKLKVCSSHFPISVSQEKDFLIIKNFV